MQPIDLAVANARDSAQIEKLNRELLIQDKLYKNQEPPLMIPAFIIPQNLLIENKFVENSSFMKKKPVYYLILQVFVVRFLKIIFFLFCRSQILLLDRRMFRPRRLCSAGRRRPRTGTRTCPCRTLRSRGGTASPSTPSSTATGPTCSTGRRSRGWGCGRG